MICMVDLIAHRLAPLPLARAILPRLDEFAADLLAHINSGDASIVMMPYDKQVEFPYQPCGHRGVGPHQIDIIDLCVD